MAGKGRKKRATAPMCNSCKGGTVKKHAIRYCPRCEGFLCKNCNMRHSRSKVTKRHKSLTIEDLNRQRPESAKSSHSPSSVKKGKNSISLLNRSLRKKGNSKTAHDSGPMTRQRIKEKEKSTRKENTRIISQTRKGKVLEKALNRRQRKENSVAERKGKTGIQDKKVVRAAKLCTQLKTQGKTVRKISIDAASDKRKHVPQPKLKRRSSKNTTCKTRGKTHPDENTLKLKRAVNIKVKTDKNNCCVLDSCVLPGGTILLVDYHNKRIKRLDFNSKAVTENFALDSEPTAICCTGPHTVAVKMKNNKVQFLSVEIAISELNKFDIPQGYVCGMAYSNEHLWVTTASTIQIYDMKGNLLRCIDKGINDRPLTNLQHLVWWKHMLLVTDGKDGVVCLNDNEEALKELRNPVLKHNRGVCVSRDGTVFLADYDTSNIVMFSKDGEFLGELVSEKEGLGKIVSLHYDSRTHSVIATNDGTSYIHILELS